jgi:hypothetical protein
VKIVFAADESWRWLPLLRDLKATGVPTLHRNPNGDDITPHRFAREKIKCLFFLKDM